MLQLLNDIPNSSARRDELHHRLESLDRADRVQLLCLALDDPYPPIRHDVAEALQQELDDVLTRFLEHIAAGVEPPENITTVLNVPRELLPDRSERARIAACVALEASPSPETTLEVIGQLITDESSDLRYQALIAMHHLDPGSSALREAALHALLHDSDSEIVVIASQIAVSNAWADMLPALLEARTRVRGEDRHQVTFSIGELIDASDATAKDLPPEIRRDMIDECIRALRDEPLTAAAARTLANIEAQEATGALHALIDRWFAHPILKVDAAVALLKLGNPRGEKYLSQALGFRRKDARGYALRMVGEHRLKRLFDHLVEVANSQGYHADTATLAIRDFGGERAQSVLANLANSHPDEEIRGLATRGLQASKKDAPTDPFMGTDGRVSNS